MDATPEAPVIKRRTLGGTGITVAEIGIGTSAIGGGSCVNGVPFGMGTTDDAVSLVALARAFQLGMNFVDTTDFYGMGHSEMLLGKALKNAPRRVVVAGRVGRVRRDPEPVRYDFSPDYIRQACDRSLNRLGVTCIDLYQLHNPPREVIADAKVWGVLRELKDKGKIAHYGVSVNEPAEGILAIEKGEAETIQIEYNLLVREAAKELLPLCEKRGVGVIARVPLLSGLLTGKYSAGHVFAENDHRRIKLPPERLARELPRVEALRFLAENTGRTLTQAALKFCLSHPAVSVVIPGIKTPQQAEEHAAASGVPDLMPDELKRIEAV